MRRQFSDPSGVGLSLHPSERRECRWRHGVHTRTRAQLMETRSENLDCSGLVREETR
jgi:hypothetical protein